MRWQTWTGGGGRCMHALMQFRTAMMVIENIFEKWKNVTTGGSFVKYIWRLEAILWFVVGLSSNCGCDLTRKIQENPREFHTNSSFKFL
jgi:hypothetical protein